MEEPKLIILDEPMNSLDENGVKDVRKYILKQKEKGVPEKIPESSKKGTGYTGRDTKTPGG